MEVVPPDDENLQENQKLLDEPQWLVERSYFLVPLDTNGQPTRKLPEQESIDLADIAVRFRMSQEEVAFFDDRALRTGEVGDIAKWFAANYSLDRLKRLSVRLVQDLDSVHRSASALSEALGQRAQLVADATGQRAVSDSSADVESGTGSSSQRIREREEGQNGERHVDEAYRRRPRRVNLIEEKKSIEDALNAFNAKLAMFETEDPASAEMLLPAKLDLEQKLRNINVQLAATGGDAYRISKPSSSAVRPEKIEEAPQHIDTNSYTSRGYVPDFPDYQDLSSSDDENDYGMAKPIHGSEYDTPFATTDSLRSGYVSGDTGSGSESDHARAEFADRGPLSMSNLASYVIDLEATSRDLSALYAGESPDHGPTLDKRSRQCDMGKTAKASRGNSIATDTSALAPSPTMKSDFARRTSMEDGDGNSSDLEKSRPYRRQRPRPYRP